MVRVPADSRDRLWCFASLTSWRNHQQRTKQEDKNIRAHRYSLPKMQLNSISICHHDLCREMPGRDRAEYQRRQLGHAGELETAHCPLKSAFSTSKMKAESGYIVTLLRFILYFRVRLRSRHLRRSCLPGHASQ